MSGREGVESTLFVLFVIAEVLIVPVMQMQLAAALLGGTGI
jgi:hypothetical protein